MWSRGLGYGAKFKYIPAETSSESLVWEEYAQVSVVVLCLNHNRSVGHEVIEIGPILIGEDHNLLF